MSTALGYRSVPVPTISRPELADSLSPIFRARIARAVGGVVLASVAASAIGWSAFVENGSHDGFKPAWLLIGSWPIAFAAMVVARALLALAGVRVSDELARAERALYRTEVSSIAWPLAGIAIAAPLTLHSFVAALGDGLGRYHEWMRISAVLVGHAHLALALHGVMFAKALHRAPSGEEHHPSVEHSWVGGLAAGVVTAAIPGILLLAIPPVIALVTGMVFIPLSYWMVRRAFANERRIIRWQMRAALEPATLSDT